MVVIVPDVDVPVWGILLQAGDDADTVDQIVCDEVELYGEGHDEEIEHKGRPYCPLYVSEEQGEA